MELLFTNRNNTRKFCIKVSGESIQELTENEIARLNEILEINDGFKWIPVRAGFAKSNKLPLIPA